VTALVGQNEGGKSNLCEALYRLNPFEAEAVYNIDEDWPADDWGGRNRAATVCEAKFVIADKGAISELLKSSLVPAKPRNASGEVQEAAEADDVPVIPDAPDSLEVVVTRTYDSPLTATAGAPAGYEFNAAQLSAWVLARLPKFVYIRDYELSGARIELDHLASRQASVPWAQLNNEEQTILIVLQLAAIDLNDFLAKGGSPDGRTLRSFDKRQASAFLTKQFARLWKQKDVRFDIDIDHTTLNIFAEDVGLGMPVRLNRRSTGFRWYVSFAWKFTHATKGQYKNCVLLLEEPGIHLHHAGHRDLLELFEELAGPAGEADKAGSDNTIIYTTHLATMLDQAYPERIRIVEVENHHSKVVNGMVSAQDKPMMVIESRLGLAGGMSGLLGNRQTLLVEGGDDAIILQKLSGVLERSNREALSERIYLFPADGAPKTPMYAGFLVGHEWDAAVLLDSDEEGEKAQKITELYLKEGAENSKFRILMLGKAAGITKTDSSVEDLLPDEFYLECVNEAYGTSIKLADLPVDGSTMITKRVEHVLKTRFGRDKLDKGMMMNQLLKHFDGWHDVSNLPAGTADRAEKLFKSINTAFA
jgi:hypothetical protein